MGHVPIETNDPFMPFMGDTIALLQSTSVRHHLVHRMVWNLLLFKEKDHPAASKVGSRGESGNRNWDCRLVFFPHRVFCEMLQVTSYSSLNSLTPFLQNHLNGYSRDQGSFEGGWQEGGIRAKRRISQIGLKAISLLAGSRSWGHELYGRREGAFLRFSDSLLGKHK